MASSIRSSLVFLCAAAAACTSVRGTTLQDAGQAIIQHDLNRARTIYEEVSAHGPRPSDRVEAERWLARLDWWFYSQPDRARARLVKAAATGVNVPAVMTELAAMETKLGHYAEARAAARRALDTAGGGGESRNARLAEAKATVAEAMGDRLSGSALPDASLLQDAKRTLLDILASEPGVLEVSRPLLAVSLLTGDGANAWRACQSYYHAAQGGDVYNLVREPMQRIEVVLATWSGGSLSADRATTLVRALSDARFFPEAAAVALGPSLDASVRSATADVVAYAAFVKAIEIQAEDCYRRTALGQGDEAALVKGFVLRLVRDWSALRIPGTPPPLGDLEHAGAHADNALQEVQRAGALDYLRKQFGLDTNFGTTAGYYDAHIGHRVADEKRTVEQFGEKANLRFIVLDSMVSNGFQSWAWCYTQEHGGWAGRDIIWKVRTDDSRSSLGQWRKATDPDERRKWDEEIGRDSAGDDARAARNPHAYLPGLAGRLARSDVDALNAALDRRGLQGEPKLLAFMADVEREGLDSNIFAHEGRHLIDRRLGIEGAADLEFRAKLSQFAFSRRPRTVLARQVLGPILGDRTPHGQAQLRIVAGLVAWMKEHGREIQSFDPTRPVLPQADLLTDDQLRAAMRSMDPLARTSP